MVSLDEQAFDNIFTHDMHDYSRYPEPPHSASSYDTSNTSPMDLHSGLYGLSSVVGYDQPSMYAEGNYILHHNRASPDMRHTLTSSSLSTNSATSSAAASPQSNPSHHMGAGPEWHHHQGLHPSIVGNDYIANPEYAGFSGVDEYFEFAQTKSFVGTFDLLFTLSIFFFFFLPPRRPLRLKFLSCLASHIHPHPLAIEIWRPTGYRVHPISAPVPRRTWYS